MKLPLTILAGTVLATALFSSLTGCSEDPPTNPATGGTGAAPSAGGSSGAGTGGSAGAGAAGGSSGQGGSTAGSGGAAGSSGSSAAGSCSIATRADPIAGASGGGGMSGGAGRAGGGRSSGGASSGGASSGGMSSGGMSSGGMSSGGMSSGGMSSGGMSSGGTSSGGMSTSGTGGTGSDNPYPPSWDTLKLVLSGTNPPCTASDCHGNGGPNVLWFPKNDDATLWRYLSTHVSIQCGNMPVVDPGHPEHSALIKILKGPCVGPCGITPRMPKDCEDSNPPNCLEDDAVEALEQWITLGAPHP